MRRPVAPEGWTCKACGEYVPNDPARPLSACKRHKSRASFAPHRLGFDWEREESWDEAKIDWSLDGIVRT